MDRGTSKHIWAYQTTSWKATNEIPPNSHRPMMPFLGGTNILALSFVLIFLLSGGGKGACNLDNKE